MSKLTESFLSRGWTAFAQPRTNSSAIIDLVALLVLCSGLASAQTQVQVFNATPLSSTEANPQAPDGLKAPYPPDGNSVRIEDAWVFDSARVPLHCEEGDTAKLITSPGEGGSVISDNFIEVNGTNVCDLGTSGLGIEGPTGNFNCFHPSGSPNTALLGTALQNAGYAGVGDIILPVGDIIPLGSSVVTFDLVDFGIVYGNTSIILETTCALPGRMTGGGSVFQSITNRFIHGFTLHCSTEAGPNRLQIAWGNGLGRGRRGGANTFHLQSLDSVICSDDLNLDEQNPVAGFDTITGTGTGRMNRESGATIEFQLTDDGEPGVGDSAWFSITPPGGGDPIVVGGTLLRGNHEAHP